MMNEAEQKRLVAGIPPWLLIALVLLVYRLPHSFDMLRADIEDFQIIEETARVGLAVARVEDGTSLFPLNLPETESMDQIDAWLEEEEKRSALLRDWLMGGACMRFRTAVALATVEIEGAKYLDEERKTLYRQLIQHKKEALALHLENLDDDELLDLVRQESKRNPLKIRKAEIIAYLLEVGEEQRERLSASWEELAPSLLQKLRPTAETGKLDRASIDVWRERVGLALNKPSFLLDLGILLIPILGLLTVILPHWRGWALEKRFGLGEHAGEFPEIDEMQAFVRRKAPCIELRENLLRPGFAFVYPKGYRRPRLAVLGGMYALWHSDPETAKGILLHEIEHVRQGDYLLVGYGSFFMKYLKWLLVGFTVLLAVHLIVSAAFSVGSVGLNLTHQARSFGTQAVMALSSTASLFFAMMSKIVVPLLGIWALELNADYGASRERVLHLEGGATTRREGWIRRIFGTLTHPPLWLRMWLAKRDDWVLGLLRQIVFPASFLIVILMFFLMGFFTNLSPEGLRAETVTWLLGLCRESFESMYWVFGGMAALMLLWPCLSGYWERFFVGEGRLYRWWDGGRYIAALLLGILAALAWWLGLST